MKKLSFLLILFLGLSTNGFSQSNNEMEQIQKKAIGFTEKLDSEIKAGDASLGLSEEQKTLIIEIHKQRIVALQKLGKDASDEDRLEINKTYYKKIFSEVLNIDQIKARKKVMQEK